MLFGFHTHLHLSLLLVGVSTRWGFLPSVIDYCLTVVVTMLHWFHVMLPRNRVIGTKFCALLGNYKIIANYSYYIIITFPSFGLANCTLGVMCYAIAGPLFWGCKQNYYELVVSQNEICVEVFV